MSGYFAIPPEAWEIIVSRRQPGPWDDWEAIADLRYWVDWIGGGPRRALPTEAELCKRWGWGNRRVRALLRDIESWADTFTGKLEASRAAVAAAQARAPRRFAQQDDSRTTVAAQQDDSSPERASADDFACPQQDDSSCAVGPQQDDSTRARDLRAGSPSPYHDHERGVAHAHAREAPTSPPDPAQPDAWIDHASASLSLQRRTEPEAPCPKTTPDPNLQPPASPATATSSMEPARRVSPPSATPPRSATAARAAPAEGGASRHAPSPTVSASAGTAMTRSNARSPTTTEADPPLVEVLTLPDGREVPPDLPGLLGATNPYVGSVHVIRYLQGRAIPDSATLLRIPANRLHFQIPLDGIRDDIAERLKTLHGITLSCLAEPAPEVETRERSPPRIPQRMQVPRGSDHDPPPSPQLALEAAALAANIRGAELARLLDHATPLNQPGETLRIRLAPAAHDLGPRLQAGVVPVVVET